MWIKTFMRSDYDTANEYYINDPNYLFISDVSFAYNQTTDSHVTVAA